MLDFSGESFERMDDATSAFLDQIFHGTTAIPLKAPPELGLTDREVQDRKIFMVAVQTGIYLSEVGRAKFLLEPLEGRCPKCKTKVKL